VPSTIGRVPETIGQVPACSAKSLRVRPSPYVFGRVSKCSAESLDGQPTRSQEVILANVKQLACLTLGIMKPSTPWLTSTQWVMGPTKCLHYAAINF
jgi:hypothetical protein